MRVCHIVLFNFLLLVGQQVFSQEIKWKCFNRNYSLFAFNSLADSNNSNSKSYLAPSSRIGANYHMLGNELYLIGGYGVGKKGRKSFLEDLWIYDVERDKWKTINYKINIKDTSKNFAVLSNASVVGYENEIYLFGGNGMNSKGQPIASNALWVFNANSMTFSYLTGDTVLWNAKSKHIFNANLPSPRHSSLSWLEGNNFYILGGIGLNINRHYTQLSDFWKFDLVLKQWTCLIKDSSMFQSSPSFLRQVQYPYLISEAGTWVFGKKLYLLGGKTVGLNGRLELNKYVWSYDCLSGIWEKESMLAEDNVNLVYSSKSPQLRLNPAIWTEEGLVYLYGGEGFDTYGKIGRLNDLWSYNVFSQEWKKLSTQKILQCFSKTTIEKENAYDISNNPGSRTLGSCFSYHERYYMFGGYSTGHFNSGFTNDLWAFQIINAIKADSQSLSSAPYLNVVHYPISGGSNTANDESNLNQNEKNFHLSPNPVKSIALVYSFENCQAVKYSVFDLSGNVQLQGEIGNLVSKGFFEIDCQLLQRGRYVLHVDFNNNLKEKINLIKE